jgi:hypothetical protein
MARYPKIESNFRHPTGQRFLCRGLDLAVRIRELPDSAMQAQVKKYASWSLARLPISPSIPARCHPTFVSHQCIVRILEGSDETWRSGSTDDTNWSRSKATFH